MRGDIADDAQHKALNHRIVVAQNFEFGYEDSIERLDTEIMAAEQRLAEAKDAAERAAEAALRRKQIDTLSICRKHYMTAAQNLEAAIRPLAAKILSADNVAAAVVGFTREIEQATADIEVEGKSYVARVAQGGDYKPRPVEPMPAPKPNEKSTGLYYDYTPAEIGEARFDLPKFQQPK